MFLLSLIHSESSLSLYASRLQSLLIINDTFTIIFQDRSRVSVTLCFTIQDITLSMAVTRVSERYLFSGPHALWMLLDCPPFLFSPLKPSFYYLLNQPALWTTQVMAFFAEITRRR